MENDTISYLKKTVINRSENPDPGLARINYLNVEQLTHLEISELLQTYQDNVENEEFIIVDNLKSKYLNRLINLELKDEVRTKLLDDKYPCFHEQLIDKNYHEYYPKIFQEDELIECFEQSSEKFFSEIKTILQNAFPNYHMRLIERTWRLYPIPLQPIHIDEFDNPSDTQILRVFINMDTAPRVATFSLKIWDVINNYPINTNEWPNSVPECLKYFYKHYLEDKSLMRYKMDFNTVHLKSGGIWIGNPATACHSGIMGYKALALDFEYECKNLNDKNKSFKSRWEKLLEKPML